MHLKLGAGEMESQSRPFVAAEGGRLSKSIIPQTGSHKAYVALDKEQGQEDDVNKMDFYKTQERVQGKMTFNYLVGGRQCFGTTAAAKTATLTVTGHLAAGGAQQTRDACH